MGGGCDGGGWEGGGCDDGGWEGGGCDGDAVAASVGLRTGIR